MNCAAKVGFQSEAPLIQKKNLWLLIMFLIPTLTIAEATPNNWSFRQVHEQVIEAQNSRTKEIVIIQSSTDASRMSTLVVAVHGNLKGQDRGGAKSGPTIGSDQ